MEVDALRQLNSPHTAFATQLKKTEGDLVALAADLAPAVERSMDKRLAPRLADFKAKLRDEMRGMVEEALAADAGRLQTVKADLLSDLGGKFDELRIAILSGTSERATKDEELRDGMADDVRWEPSSASVHRSAAAVPTVGATSCVQEPVEMLKPSPCRVWKDSMGTDIVVGANVITVDLQTTSMNDKKARVSW